MMTENKYRWHDLRKNPEDFPKDAHTVIVCYVGRYDTTCPEGIKRLFKDQTFAKLLWEMPQYTMLKHFCEDKEEEIDEGWYGVCSDKTTPPEFEVIAWREIEPFEVVEDEEH